MRIFIDLDTNNIITSPGAPNIVTELEFKRAAFVPLEVQFCRDGQIVELATGATGVFGIKTSGKYDSDFIASASSWLKVGTGTETYYIFSFTLITTPIDDLLFVDADPDNDVVSVTFMGEVQWTISGNDFKSQTVDVIVNNDVIRGDETPAAMPVIAYGIFLPDIIHLTGGTSTDLDFLPTVGLATGYIVELMIDTGGGVFEWVPCILRTVSAGAGVVTPLDYNAGTNNRRWQTATALMGPTGPAGADGADGDPGPYQAIASATIPAGSAVDIDWDDSNTFNERTLAANTTFTHINADDGQVIIVPIRNTASNFTVAWVGVTEWKGTGGVAPTQSGGAVTDLYTFAKIGSKIFGTWASGA